MEPPPMSDIPTIDIDAAIRKLADDITKERVPKRILALSRELQAMLDVLDEKSRGRRID